MTDLAALAATLTAVDPNATSWAWASADEIAYIDCSPHQPGTWLLEVGDGQETAQIEVSLGDLREIHRRLTTALIAATAA